MPFPVSHVLVGASIVAAIYPQPTKKHFLPLLIGGFLAVAPDFDFLLVLIFGSYELHRSFTHSLLMSLIVSVIFLFTLDKNKIREAAAYGLAFTSHCILDYLTTKTGDGVELFYPFSRERMSYGICDFAESTEWYMPMEVIKSVTLESLVFVPPFLLILLLRNWLKNNQADAIQN